MQKYLCSEILYCINSLYGVNLMIRGTCLGSTWNNTTTLQVNKFIFRVLNLSVYKVLESNLFLPSKMSSVRRQQNVMPTKINDSTLYSILSHIIQHFQCRKQCIEQKTRLCYVHSISQLIALLFDVCTNNDIKGCNCSLISYLVQPAIFQTFKPSNNFKST